MSSAGVAVQRERPAAPGGAQATEGRSPWQLAWRRLRTDRVAIISAVVIVVIAVTAIAAPVFAAITHHGPNEQFNTTGLTVDGLPRPPSGQFWFGTDDLGRDVLVRIVYGARISLFAGVVASLLSVAFGTVVGMFAGYFGGATDSVLSRTMDVVLSMPFLLFAIALVALVGPGLWISVSVIAFFSWASVGRVTRGQTLSIKEKEYIEAARSVGAGGLRVIFIDVLPNVIAPVIVYTTLLIPASIAFMATLSFLGIGIVPPTPDWGNMIAESLQYYRVAWWFVLFPGLALLITTLAFNMLGDAVRDALDPNAERIFAQR
ncbi:MAG TPA: ABC transporter permease [Streptosporangiaceae bacterium]